MSCIFEMAHSVILDLPIDPASTTSEPTLLKNVVPFTLFTAETVLPSQHEPRKRPFASGSSPMGSPDYELFGRRSTGASSGATMNSTQSGKKGSDKDNNVGIGVFQKMNSKASIERVRGVTASATVTSTASIVLHDLPSRGSSISPLSESELKNNQGTESKRGSKNKDKKRGSGKGSSGHGSGLSAVDEAQQVSPTKKKRGCKVQ
eukprot:TRINITY_DN5715_c0_g1_i1.p1 TRINITY_DN5715_c0_g1~~TRINITY_DN5715_c0_g1_i1.p1  ORF type:complete len:205 (-),score=53.68 TRINITY_DN5715_c0_g1_i1:75-689(-)